LAAIRHASSRVINLAARNFEATALPALLRPFAGSQLLSHQIKAATLPPQIAASAKITELPS
jgi:hypothetical protein